MARITKIEDKLKENPESSKEYLKQLYSIIEELTTDQESSDYPAKERIALIEAARASKLVITALADRYRNSVID